jgi:hypothetical protein
MTSKKHRLIAYAVAIQLLLIAIVCYAAFPVKAPEQPLRIEYHTNAGRVLFDHQAHASASGIALDCYDCHHHPPGDEEALVSCKKCHLAEIKKDEVPDSCLECHDAGDVEGTEIPKESDAFHHQCIQCHVQFGAGPGEGPENCSKCHVL